MPLDAHRFFKEVILSRSPSPEDFRRLVELLWESYGEEVYLFAYAKLERLEDARDICQDTFVKAIEWLEKNPKQIPSKVNFPAWLRRITRNLIIDRFRRPALEFQWPCSADSSQNKQSMATDWPEPKTSDPAEHVSKAEELDALQQCIEALPDKRKQVLTLREIEGMSYETIAREIGVSSSTIGMLLHRTRKELRECVELRLAM